MTAVRIVFAKLRALVHRSRDDAALAEELATHADLLVEDLVAGGMSPEEARREARLRLGGALQVAEAARDQRGLPWLDALARDLRLAFRSLRQNPLFAVSAVLSLAVGVAANTVGFAFLYGFLIRPLPFTSGSRLVSVIASAPSRGQDRWPTRIEELRAIQSRSRSFDAIGAGSVATLDLTGTGQPLRVEVGVPSAGLFQMLGIRPLLGRLFSEEDVAGTSGRVAILGEALWRSTFNADPAVVGRAITLSGDPYTVVGVVPAWPSWNPWARLYVPIDKSLLGNTRERRYRFIARLAPGVTIGQANRELERLSGALAKEFPADNGGIRLFAESHRTDLLDDERQPVLVLYAVVTLLLLLACANVATLLVMRSVSRSGEFAIRASLGAGRLQIVRQMLTEHALVTLAGGWLGVLAGVWARDRLEPVVNPASRPFRFDLDPPAVALLAGIVLGCAFLFGGFSAWAVTRHAFTAPHAASPGRPGSDRARLRTGLAVFEVAAAVLVLVTSGLMLKGALHAASRPPGFDTRNVLTMEVRLPDSEAGDAAKVVQFFRELTDRVRALPGVESASAGNPPPFIGWSVACEVEGRDVKPGSQAPRAMDAVVMPGYFHTLRIPILEGRDVSAHDAEPNAPPVIVVGETFARATWPGESALGHRVRMLRAGEPDGPWRQVVGVVGDTRTSTFTPPGGWVYMPHGQPAFSELILMIRFRGDPAPIVRDVQRMVWKAKPGLPMHWNDLLDDLIARRYWQPRVLPRLFLVFAALALAVALVGVYGVVAYASARRAREFGIRLAIGSPPLHVWRLVARQGLRLAAAGTALGVLAALGVMRLAVAVFFGVSPTDAWVYAGCAILAVVAVLAASAAPAFRAARIDPVTVLRCE